MIVNRAYKVEIKPNNVQKTFLNKSIGIARLAYNWGLNLCIERYEQCKKYLGSIGLHKELCSIKKNRFPFMYEVSKLAPQNALKDLDVAFKNFFKRKDVGFPKFKSKKNDKQTFRIDGANIKVNNNSIKLPNISSIRLKEHNYIPFGEVKYMNATISKEIDRYYVSVIVREEVDIYDKPVEEVIGIDVGIKELATCSNGEVYHNPKFTKKYENKLKREQKKLSRKKKGSQNRNKAKIKVAKVHRKIRNSRVDNLHKTTSSITKIKCRMIVLEDLNTKGMMKNHCLSKAVADSSFYEFRRQLEYKTKFYGGSTYLIDRWFPSSKTCSCCGTIKEDLTLSDRIYKCDCGFEMDRDLNASINIQNYYTVSSTGIKAFGENVRLGSDLIAPSSLVELGSKHETQLC
ncbi:MAG: transposase [Candidatus Thorarchaeota archaeon]|nr:MAG: transposase [Candidatus Thorarchaeota archaeon]